jgi:hypothetical protein
MPISRAVQATGIAMGLIAISACRSVHPPAAGDNLEDLIAKHTLARGGAAAIESARTVEMRLRIVEPKVTVEGLYRASRSGRMRIDVFVEGKRVYSEGYDGQHGWELAGGAEHVVDSSPTGEAALRHGLEYPTNLRGLHEMRPRGHQLQLSGREIVDGTSYYVLELKLDDGFVTYLYLNPTTYLIDRQRDIRAMHPAIDPSQKWIEQRFEDYRNVDGRMVSFKSSQVDLRTGQVMQTTTVLEIKTNPPLTDETFARP